jgi:hypothetical protein
MRIEMIPETSTTFKQLTQLIAEERFYKYLLLLRYLKIYKNYGNVYTLCFVVFEVFMAVNFKNAIFRVFMAVTVKSSARL